MGHERSTRILVIGGGPGGYTAAFRAADAGLSTTLIDAGIAPGGVCLHRGCIPSKALLHVARLLHETREAARWGVRFAPPEIDLDALRNWKSGVIDRLAGGVVELCRRRKVELFSARAAFIDAHTVSLQTDGDETRTLTYDHAIIATGSAPALPGAFDIGDPRVTDSTGALALTDVPERLLVIGGGYIGLEMGTVYEALGSRVTVAEFTDGLLPGVDRDLVRPLKARLDDAFDAILLGTKVDRLVARDDGIAVTLRGQDAPEPSVFDRVLVAVGRSPNTTGLGLENTRVALDERGFVRVDAQQRTDEPHLFAVGDVAGEPMLAHKASREAKVAIEVVAGKPTTFDHAAIPAVVFTDPEIAWCGLTETQARSDGRKVKSIRYPWAASGRAVTLDRTEGVTKLIVDPTTERVLGMGICGVNAGEMIAEGVLAIETGATVGDLADRIHAHPTLSETVGEAADAFHGNATHLYRPKNPGA
jgi:dihydrolipoamide dehydrogenase